MANNGPDEVFEAPGSSRDASSGAGEGVRKGRPRPERARPEDAGQVAALHADGIREGFLTTLGPRFLGMLYGRMATSPNAVLLVTRERGRVSGFVAGAAAPGAFYREFLRSRAVAASALLAGRALRPRVARGIADVLRHLRGGDGPAGPELLAIAVGERARRGGAGRALVEALERELRTAGADRLAVVVGEGNVGARAFYGRVGFGLVEEAAVHRDRRSLRYEKAL